MPMSLVGIRAVFSVHEMFTMWQALAPFKQARSRGASLTNGAGDFSDRDSFRSASDSEASDDSDDLDLDPEDIPVTGFAVASNKRNQDFHELFPSVPEGDYLIEGECPTAPVPIRINSPVPNAHLYL